MSPPIGITFYYHIMILTGASNYYDPKTKKILKLVFGILGLILAILLITFMILTVSEEPATILLGGIGLVIGFWSIYLLYQEINNKY